MSASGAANAPAFHAGEHLSGRLLVGPGERWSLRIERRALLLCLVMTAVVLALGVVALGFGKVEVSPARIVATLLGNGNRTEQLVVNKIRLPRYVAGITVGAALGTSGAVFQSISRNALGSPDIIGFTTGAATGAIVQIVYFGGGPAAVALSAVAGGFGAALVVYFLARERQGTGGYRLVLVGIGAGAMLTGVNALMLTRSNVEVAVTANEWLVGNLNARMWPQVLPVVIVVVAFVPALGLAARRLQMIEMGDDLASQLGISVERTRSTTMMAGVGLIAVAIACAGPIGFIALAAPQVARRLSRSQQVPVVTAAFTGAALLSLADLLGQRLPVNVRMPVGIVSGLVGGLYLIALLTRSKQT